MRHHNKMNSNIRVDVIIPDQLNISKDGLLWWWHQPKPLSTPISLESLSLEPGLIGSWCISSVAASIHYDTQPFSDGEWMRICQGCIYLSLWIPVNLLKRYSWHTATHHAPVPLLFRRYVAGCIGYIITAGWWWLEYEFYFPIQSGMSSSQLTNSYFSEG